MLSADRQRVLTHHPDKHTTDEQKEGGDDFFKCIKIGGWVGICPLNYTYQWPHVNAVLSMCINTPSRRCHSLRTG